MKKITKAIAYGFFCLLFLYIQIRLYYRPAFNNGPEGTYNRDLYAQLTYLEPRMHEGAASAMQQVYPEGFVFSHALYGLAQAQFMKALVPGTPLYAHAHSEAIWAWKEICSPAGTLVFDSAQALPYGAFHFGWSNYLLALIIEASTEKDTLLNRLFRQNCDLLAGCADTLETPYAESYPGAAWPADMLVCMAALSAGNRIFGNIYENTLTHWLQRADSRTDSRKLIPHAYDTEKDRVSQEARGSSQSLILIMLHEIDSTYARRKFKIYREHFLTYRLGLAALREYPYKENGGGDIDSGPVIWGAGGAASIVGVYTMNLFGAHNTGISLRNSIELFGLPYTCKGEKSYLLGQWIMADLFIAWVNAQEFTPEAEMKESRNWRLPVQAGAMISLILISCRAYGRQLKRFLPHKKRHPL